ncbi:hypothetical protein EDF56_10744 [Novosphingobium sp. PhB165]|nr:hypothetical protein EDF56_10744 [Novosphingobium sp. PhB165]
MGGTAVYGRGRALYNGVSHLLQEVLGKAADTLVIFQEDWGRSGLSVPAYAPLLRALIDQGWVGSDRQNASAGQ